MHYPEPTPVIVLQSPVITPSAIDLDPTEPHATVSAANTRARGVDAPAETRAALPPFTYLPRCVLPDAAIERSGGCECRCVQCEPMLWKGARIRRMRGATRNALPWSATLPHMTAPRPARHPTGAHAATSARASRSIAPPLQRWWGGLRGAPRAAAQRCRWGDWMVCTPTCTQEARPARPRQRPAACAPLTGRPLQGAVRPDAARVRARLQLLPGRAPGRRRPRCLRRAHHATRRDGRAGRCPLPRQGAPLPCWWPHAAGRPRTFPPRQQSQEGVLRPAAAQPRTLSPTRSLAAGPAPALKRRRRDGACKRGAACPRARLCRSTRASSSPAPRRRGGCASMTPRAPATRCSPRASCCRRAAQRCG